MGGPIVTIRNEQQRSGRNGCGDFCIGCLLSGPFMDRHSAFANTTSEKISGNHYDRHGYINAVIHGREHKCLGAAPGFASNRQTACIHSGQRTDKVKRADAVEQLELKGLVDFVVALVTVSHPNHIVGEYSCPHAGQGCTALLGVFLQTTIVTMSMRA